MPHDEKKASVTNQRYTRTNGSVNSLSLFLCPPEKTMSYATTSPEGQPGSLPAVDALLMHSSRRLFMTIYRRLHPQPYQNVPQQK